MSEMIERVRAAWRHAERFGRDPAEAAVKAMREPLESMLVAGWEHTADPCWKENVADAWRAMIDAALSEDKH